MDLRAIDEAKTGMEAMMDKIYTLQEAITEGNKEKKEAAKDVYTSGIRELYYILIKSTSTSQSDTLAKRELALVELSRLVSRCSKIPESKLSQNTGRRIRELVLPRQIHMALAAKTFGMSLANAGKIYTKDHATVLHAAKTIRNLWQTDRHFREKYAPVFNHCFAYDLDASKTKTIDFLTEK